MDSRVRGNGIKEIPAFAGMAVLFVFADDTEFGGTFNLLIKNTPFRRKPESLQTPFPRKRESN
ncbi:MAG: hypothetical protein ACR2QC_05695 [Gammaproteobacteria bacterium]